MSSCQELPPSPNGSRSTTSLYRSPSRFGESITQKPTTVWTAQSIRGRNSFQPEYFKQVKARKSAENETFHTPSGVPK